MFDALCGDGVAFDTKRFAEDVNAFRAKSGLACSTSGESGSFWMEVVCQRAEIKRRLLLHVCGAAPGWRSQPHV